MVPIGTIIDYAGHGVPSGYFPCDGRDLDRTIYAALFEVIGVTYGVGDGSTTFTIPDCAGRVVIGAGEGDLTSRFQGQAGGSETVPTYDPFDSKAKTPQPGLVTPHDVPVTGDLPLVPIGSDMMNPYIVLNKCIRYI